MAFPLSEYYALIRLPSHPSRPPPYRWLDASCRGIRRRCWNLPSSRTVLSVRATLSDPVRPSGHSPFACPSCWLRVHKTPSPTDSLMLSRLKWLQAVRSALWPTPFPVYASLELFGSIPLPLTRLLPSSLRGRVPHLILSVVVPPFFPGLLLKCNTRYKWLAKPFFAGTSTLPGPPSLPWRSLCQSVVHFLF